MASEIDGAVIGEMGFAPDDIRQIGWRVDDPWVRASIRAYGPLPRKQREKISALCAASGSSPIYSAYNIYGGYFSIEGCVTSAEQRLADVAPEPRARPLFTWSEETGLMASRLLRLAIEQGIQALQRAQERPETFRRNSDVQREQERALAMIAAQEAARHRAEAARRAGGGPSLVPPSAELPKVPRLFGGGGHVKRRRSGRGDPDLMAPPQHHERSIPSGPIIDPSEFGWGSYKPGKTSFKPPEKPESKWIGITGEATANPWDLFPWKDYAPDIPYGWPAFMEAVAAS